MLPFTKRAGRGPRDEDVDVVTKDDLAKSSTLSSRPLMRPPAESVGDDDMTNIVSSKAIGHIVPAAGRPASQPPPSLRGSGRLPPSVRPPPPSVRPPPSSFSGTSRAQDDDQEDDDGRTAIRGAPRIVKRSTGRALANGQGQIAPATVNKATLESARATGARRDALLAGTPSDLRDETDDRLGFTEAIRPDRVPFVRSAQPLQMEPAPQSVTPATGYGPPSSNPAPNGNSSYRAGNPATMPYQGPQVHALHPNMALAQTAYASQPPPSHAHPMMGPASSRGAFQQGPFTPRSSPPGAPGSAPAHFMTPQNGRYADPPGTAVTSGHRVPSGRPAASWAVALLACGLFVGVAAVAVTQGSEAAADTTASFVDPSRSTTKVAAAQAPAPAQQAAAPQQGGVIGASPVQDPTPAKVAAAPTMPGVFGSMPAAAPVAPAPVAPSATIASGGVLGGFAPVAVASKSETKEAKPAPRPAWHAAPRPAPAKVATNDEPKEAKEPPASKKKAAAPDDETKKALEALQKAQLESSNSFGN